MRKILILGSLWLTSLSGCQQPTTPAQEASADDAQAGAVEAVRRYLQTQPNAALYVLDSARVVDAGSQWQVLVPRTDWVGRMPNRDAFEVEKATGQVKTRPVK